MKSRPRPTSAMFFIVPTTGVKSSAVSSAPPTQPLRRIALPSVSSATTAPSQGIARVSLRVALRVANCPIWLTHTHARLPSKNLAIGPYRRVGCTLTGTTTGGVALRSIRYRTVTRPDGQQSGSDSRIARELGRDRVVFGQSNRAADAAVGARRPSRRARAFPPIARRRRRRR